MALLRVNVPNCTAAPVSIFCGKDKVKLPSPLLVDVIWFVVPAIQAVKSETEVATLEPLVESNLLAVVPLSVTFTKVGLALDLTS